MSRDSDVTSVITKLNSLMEELRGNVDQLSAILVPPQPEPGGEKVAS